MTEVQDNIFHSVDNRHPQYQEYKPIWEKVRDCLAGEERIKSKREKYLPRPAGMSGEYEAAYDMYIERAHFPLTTSYALAGALGLIITKAPDFNVPPELDYIKDNATGDGRSLKQLFIDIIIEEFNTGRCPVSTDIIENQDRFKFVLHTAEDLINWKTDIFEQDKLLTLAVFREKASETEDPFSHEYEDAYRVLSLDEQGNYVTQVYVPIQREREGQVIIEFVAAEDEIRVPRFMGRTLNKIPMYVCGSISVDYDVQSIPLISVANNSIQIYRKEADLANSEFLSCNPTLVITGATNDDELPNVVGSSVMIAIPDPQAQVFYTKTDTAALTHIRDHIKDLQEEAILHGAAILDARKGVESPEALRLRQATQSATIYSIYLSAVEVIKKSLINMCEWAGYDASQVIVDAPSELTQGIPDAQIIKTLTEAFAGKAVPLNVVHRYLVSVGLIDQGIGYQEYLQILRKEGYEALFGGDQNTETNSNTNSDNGSDEE